MRAAGAAARNGSGAAPDVPRALCACNAVGARVVTHGRVDVENLGRITLGDDVRVEGSPVATHLVTGPEGVLELGRGVRIGHGCGITAHAAVRIGDGASLGAFVMVMDTDFHVAGAKDARAKPAPITVGANARLGHRVIVLRGSTIGEGARVAPGSVVSGVVPPFVEVAGVPARPIGAPMEDAAGTAERVLAVVARTVGTGGELTPSHRVEMLPSWDSLARIHLLLSLEDVFDVELSPPALATAQTLGDVARLVDAALAARRVGGSAA